MQKEIRNVSNSNHIDDTGRISRFRQLRTYSIKKKDVENNWLLLDAKGKCAGKLATLIVHCLCGKHKPTFTPHMDDGDNIIVINTAAMKFTGNKLQTRVFYRHTQFVGSIKKETLQHRFDRKPNFVLQEAVRRMLPKNSLCKKMLSNVRFYENDQHRHQAQNPTIIECVS